jgi:hypothetical protein
LVFFWASKMRRSWISDDSVMIQSQFSPISLTSRIFTNQNQCLHGPLGSWHASLIYLLDISWYGLYFIAF